MNNFGCSATDAHLVVSIHSDSEIFAAKMRINLVPSLSLFEPRRVKFRANAMRKNVAKRHSVLVKVVPDETESKS